MASVAAARRRLHAIASHAAAAGSEAPEATPNAPRGSAQQGFGTGWHDRSPALQPPVFDPVRQLREACAYYSEHGFCVVDALSRDEVAEMDAVADMFLRDTGATELAGEAFAGKAGPGAGQGQLFYPLLGTSHMHIAYARGGWLQLDNGSWRAPSAALFQLCIPKRLAATSDPDRRKLFSLWSASMCEWAANDFDPAYIADAETNPTRRAPRPGH